MTKSEQYRDHMYHMLVIWTTGWHNVQMANYMDNPRTEEEGIYIESNPFLQRIKNSLFRVAVLEVVKLIKPNRNQEIQFACAYEHCPSKKTKTQKSDRYTIDKLISKVGSADKTAAEVEIKAWSEFQDENKIAIENILKVRNKLYAHRDDEMILDAGFTFDELIEVFSFVRWFIENFSKKINVNKVTFNDSISLRLENWDDFRILAEHRIQRRIQ